VLLDLVYQIDKLNYFECVIQGNVKGATRVIKRWGCLLDINESSGLVCAISSPSPHLLLEFETTALHEACGRSNPEMVSFLLKSGAHLHSRDKVCPSCSTPLCSSIVLVISRQYGRTPLHDACRRDGGNRGHVGIVSLLLEAGADVMALDLVSV
jgi:ankyrin repeat protein